LTVGYSVSPLHTIRYFDPRNARAEPLPRDGRDPIQQIFPDTKRFRLLSWAEAFRSAPKADILAWRAGVSAKYLPQLGQPLDWDEDSNLSASEDLASSSDLSLRFVAAVLDRHGDAAVRALARRPLPAESIVDATLAGACGRGFAGRFPHLLLGARTWFPFKRHIIIEEPDWTGRIARYGSLDRLKEEIEAVRACIGVADPSATAWTAKRDTPQDDALASAWQASDAVSRLCDIAVACRVPLWKTE
jgi:hypothetical protein